MDYEMLEGTVTRWFQLECGDCEHKWEHRMEVTTFKSGAVAVSYECPKCKLFFEGELFGENCYDWEGENY
jgi:hypothetical protein